jgi:capsular polysaccharide biosynthesis protein
MELRALLNLLRRKGWILLITLLMAMTATTFYSLQQPTRYESKATFIANINRDFIDDRNATSALDVLGRRTEIVTTYSEVIKSRRIRQMTAEQMGLSPRQANSLSVASRVVAGTTMIELTVTGQDPTLVFDYAQTVGDSAIAYIHDLYEMYSLAHLDAATYPRAIKSAFVMNLAMGAAVGLALGIALILLSSFIDDLRNPPATSDVLSPSQQAANMLALQSALQALQLQLEASQQLLQQFYTADHGAEPAPANNGLVPEPANRINDNRVKPDEHQHERVEHQALAYDSAS